MFEQFICWQFLNLLKLPTNSNDLLIKWLLYSIFNKIAKKQTTKNPVLFARLLKSSSRIEKIRTISPEAKLRFICHFIRIEKQIFFYKTFNKFRNLGFCRSPLEMTEADVQLLCIFSCFAVMFSDVGNMVIWI